MTYQYRIRSISDSDRWIYISSDDEFEMDFEEPDAFFYLIQSIQKDVGGDVTEVGPYQYMISGETLGLVFQWDGVFGITVMYPLSITKEQSVTFLSKYLADFK